MSNHRGTNGPTPFPFFRLPSEIRNNNYSILFRSEDDDHLITPDPLRSRDRNFITQNQANMSDSLALLRTCQQAHEEATAVLYGSNIFYFSDRTHGIDTHNMTNFGNYMIPMCDFITMYPFLCAIGAHNRARIHNIRLGFFGKWFTTYMHERSPRHESSTWVGGGAGFIGDALDLLSQGHNLIHVEIQFGTWKYQHSLRVKEEEETLEDFKDVFSRRATLPRRFQQVRGIKELRVLTPKDTHLTGKRQRPLGSFVPKYQGFLQVKREMESGDFDKEEETKREKWQRIQAKRLIFGKSRYGFAEDPIDQSVVWRT